ncbi:MAG: serine hydrolase domain-containing protein [Ornithinimicrobium sp.]
MRSGHDEVRALLEGYVERGIVPGVVGVRGDLSAEPDVVAVGHRSVGGVAMDGTEIVRIQSMAKAITAVATLRLIDHGVLDLDDDVATWLPELASRRVLRSPTSSLDDTVAADGPITVRHLLTNTSGYGMILQDCALQRAMAANDTEAGPLPDDTDASAWLARLAELPLAFAPGRGWRYHHSYGVLGILLARVTGASLHDHLVAELFEPLGMRDTGMWVPQAKRNRLPAVYRHTDGHLRELEPAGGGSQSGRPDIDVSHWEQVSTAGDYWRFLRALHTNVDGDGEALLSGAHHAAMLSDQVPRGLKTDESFFPGFWEGMGGGFGVCVYTEGPRRGRYGWAGGVGTDFFVDPDGTAGLLCAQVEWTESTMPLMQEFASLEH